MAPRKDFSAGVLMMLLIISIIIVSCSLEPVPEPTATPVPPSQTPETVIPLELVFDGSSCVYSGPEEFVSGNIPVVFVNQSDQSASMKSAILGQDGEFADFQTLLESLGDPGSEADLTLFRGPFSRSTLAGKTWEGERPFNPGIYALACTVSNQAWMSDAVITVK